MRPRIIGNSNYISIGKLDNPIEARLIQVKLRNRPTLWRLEMQPKISMSIYLATLVLAGLLLTADGCSHPRLDVPIWSNRKGLLA